MSRRLWLGGTALAVVLAAAGGFTYLKLNSDPDYRTDFLVDASAGGDLAAVAGSVGASARNAADGDALALRRFGGTCGAADNTARVVPSAVGAGPRIAEEAGKLTAAGQPTLLSGVLAAIDDFAAGPRGAKVNRIVVVSRHGADACEPDRARLDRAIQDKVRAAGLRIDFRYVGYQVPTDQRAALTALATASGGAAPSFVADPAALTATLGRLVVPENPDAAPVVVPSLDPTADWPARPQPAAHYALRVPPSWIVVACDMGSGPFLQITQNAAMFNECTFHPIDLGVMIGTRAAEGDWVNLKDPAYGDRTEQAATVGGMPARRVSATLIAPPDGPVSQEPGTRIVRYFVQAGGRPYTFTLGYDPADPAAAGTLADFDLMVTRTVTFTG